jgi:uncharacterized protein
MRLIVSDIPEEGLEQELEIPVVTGDDAKPDNARAALRFLRLGKTVLVDGSINISVSLRCSRCLGEFTYPLGIQVREEYNPVEEISQEGEHELTSRDLDLGFYNDDELDISEMVTEQVLLSVPMKPLCGEHCRGICPVCGKNLNEGACTCAAETVDPRLAPLKQFKESMERRKE